VVPVVVRSEQDAEKRNVRSAFPLQIEVFLERARQDSNLRPTLFVASLSDNLYGPVGLDKAFLPGLLFPLPLVDPPRFR
jgi:hypothetical protein